MERILRHDPAVVHVWKGPAGGRHDFQGGAAALEVKTTCLREGWSVEVHGLWQLQPPEGCQLFLAVLRLLTSPEGLSVPALIDRIQALEPDPLAFEAGLAQVGYDHADRAEYEKTRFEVAEYRTYRVDDAMPRIVPGSFAGGELPAGVTRLVYRIDLSTRPPVPLDETETEPIYVELARG